MSPFIGFLSVLGIVGSASASSLTESIADDFLVSNSFSHSNLAITSFTDSNYDTVPDLIGYDLETNSLSVAVFSGSVFTELFYFSAKHSLINETFHILQDENGDDISEVGVFGFNSALERYQLYVYNVTTGKKVDTWNWVNTIDDAQFLLLNDLTGDGIKEYAITGLHAVNGTRQVVVKNSESKATYQTFKWPNIFEQPQIVTMSDITGDSVPEVALYGKHKKMGKGQLFVYDGQNANTKVDVYNWNPNWTEFSIFSMDDIDSDGTVDWGQFGKRLDDGRYQWVIKKGHDKKGVLRTFSWPNDLHQTTPMLVADRTYDGIRDVAITGRDANEKYFLRINDGRLSNQRIANISWPANWNNVEILELGDLNSDGLHEYALQGYLKSNGKWQLIIKDGLSLKEYGRYTLPMVLSDIDVSSYDVDGDNKADVIINGVNNVTAERVGYVLSGLTLSELSLNDNDSDGVIDIVDQFPEDASEWLDTDFDGIGNNADDDDDDDGLTDINENNLGTNPLLGDSDGDGLNDFDESQNNLNPNDASDGYYNDTDNDSMINGLEVAFNLDPNNSADGVFDYDNDGLTNAEELFVAHDIMNYVVARDGGYSENGWTAKKHDEIHFTEVTTYKGTVVNHMYDGGSNEPSWSRMDSATNAAFSHIYREGGSLTYQIATYKRGLFSLQIPAISGEGKQVLAFEVREHSGGVRLDFASLGDFDIELPEGQTNEQLNEYRFNFIGQNSFAGELFINDKFIRRFENLMQHTAPEGNGYYFSSASRSTVNTSSYLASVVLTGGDTLYSNPNKADSDDDGLSDPVEYQYGLNPLNNVDGALSDTDGDGLANQVEINKGLDPLDGTDQQTTDSDDDGMSNADEISFARDPFVFDDYSLDSDNDGLTDGEELIHGLNPNDASDASADNDQDGIINADEIRHGLNLNDASDGATIDTDGDGVTNGDEIANNFDPLNSEDQIGIDSDDDGVNNDIEIRYGANPFVTDPYHLDSDEDTLTDAEEMNNGTDPHNVDTDGDGVNDNLDVYPGQNDAIELALASGNADLLSKQQLTSYLNSEYSTLVGSCQATMLDIYPNGFVDTNVVVNTSSTFVFNSNFKQNVPVQIAHYKESIQKITWVGQQDQTNRYAVFGYNTFDYKDFKNTLGNSTADILTWVLNEQENVFEKAITVVVFNSRARDDLESWLEINYPSNNWNIVEHSSDPSVLDSGDYDLFFGILTEVNDDPAYKTALFNDKKPVIFYNTEGNEATLRGTQVLTDIGLDLIENTDDREINSDEFSQHCITAYQNIKAIITAIENIESGNVPVDYNASNCSKTCDYNDVITRDGDNAYTAYGAAFDSLNEYIVPLTLLGKDLFDQGNGYNIIKGAYLIGDKYRHEVTYPMHKVDNAQRFSAAYFGDMTVQLARKTNLAQPDLGYYGVGFTSAELAQTPTVNQSVLYTPRPDKTEWRTGKVYLLPGVPATIRRTDNKAISVKLKLNILRENRRIWQESTAPTYDGVKNVTSNTINLKSNVDYVISHPYGGPLYIEIESDGTAEPVTIDYKNIAVHPVLSVTSEGVSLAEATKFNDHINSSKFAIFDIITPNDVVYHITRPMFYATMEKQSSLANGYEPQDIINWIDGLDKFIVRETYIQHGLLDDVLPEHSSYVREFCSRQNLVAECADTNIHVKARRQHANIEWNAACGSGCSGNPLDSGSVVTPMTGYLISHEIGHNLQTSKTKIYGSSSTEVSTNIYPYRALSKYYQSIGLKSRSYSRASMKFDLAYKAVQTSLYHNANGNTDWQMGASHPIWQGNDSTKWQDINGDWHETEDVRRAFYTQFFFIHGSFDVLTPSFVLERIANNKAIDENTWVNYRDALGFSSYSKDEYKTITAEDFLAISLSLSTQLNHVNYFNAWGIALSSKAVDQITANGQTINLPLQMYKVPDDIIDGKTVKNPIYSDIFGEVIELDQDEDGNPDNIREFNGDLNQAY